MSTAPAAILVASGETKLVASDAADNDHFGFEVGISGDTIVAGVPDDAVTGGGTGSVRVFVRSGSAWGPEATLTGGASSLGWSVAIDGDTVIAGAPQASASGASWAGAAVVFTRSGGTWTAQATLNGAGAIDEKFGESVAIQGDTALVGATGGASLKGAAYVFERVGTNWTKQSLAVGDLQLGDAYGEAVALSGDTAIVGAPDQAAYSGTAYVFVRASGVWTQQAKLKPSGLVASDLFGKAVALSGDTALIGAPQSDSTGVNSSGVAYVFVRSGATWEQKAKLVAADASLNGQFGSAVALRGDAAIVGSMWKSAYAGAAYLMQGSGATWTQQAKLTASDGVSQDYLGSSVAIGGDAVVLGAFGDDNPGAVNSGSAYVFSVKASQGSTCTAASGCQSGFCVDGVCCDTECGGSKTDCQACSTNSGAATNGTCAVLAAQISCRAAASACDVAEVCDGVSSTCPADGFAAAGTACDDGNICTTGDACNGKGACSAATTLDCADQNECTTDLCDEQSGCMHPTKNNGTACSAGICIAGKCVAPGQGGTGGAGGQSGGAAGMSGSTSSGGASTGGGSAGGTGGANGGHAGTSSSSGSGDDGGCSCRLVSRRDTEPLWLGLAVLALVGARRRRFEA